MSTSCDNNLHQHYMRLALKLAKQGAGNTAPNPMVGCVFVKNGQVIGQGYHKKCGEDHAEVNAINNVKDKADIKNSICYVTLEPCCHYGKTGPCADELIKYEIKQVVIAVLDPNPLVAGKGVALLKKASVEVTIGVCESEAADLNRGFFSRVKNNRPFVYSKIAASLDGGVALANGQSKWITNELCREDVHQLRAASDAIVTTAATILADDCRLTARLQGQTKQPLRVVIDKNLDTDVEYGIYSDIARTIIITTVNLDVDAPQDKTTAEKIKKFKEANIALYNLGLDNHTNNINILAVWELLAELGCNNVMIEAGGRFNSYLLKNNLVDEWVIYQSGLIMGGQAQNMFDIETEQHSMSDLFKLKCKQIKQFGDNWRVILSPYN